MMSNKEAKKRIETYIVSENDNIPRHILEALQIAINTLDKNANSDKKNNGNSLFVVSNNPFGATIRPDCYVTVNADCEKEAKELGKLYLTNDSRIMFPKMLSIATYKNMCPEIINRDNIEDLIRSNQFKRSVKNSKSQI